MVYSPSHSFHLIQSFHCPIQSLKINILGASLDKVLILDRYSLFEVELGWFCYSLFIRNKKYNTLYKILERIIRVVALKIPQQTKTCSKSTTKTLALLR